MSDIILYLALVAVGAGAAGMQGQESKILGSVFKYFVLYVVVASLLCMAGTILIPQ